MVSDVFRNITYSNYDSNPLHLIPKSAGSIPIAVKHYLCNNFTCISFGLWKHHVHLLSAEPIKSARICISANNYDLFNSHVCEIYLCSKHNHSFTIAYLLRRPIQPVMSMPIRRLKFERKACVAVSHTRSFPFVSHQLSPPYIFERRAEEVAPELYTI
jgi:hypothetical protein